VFSYYTILLIIYTVFTPPSADKFIFNVVACYRLHGV